MPEYQVIARRFRPQRFSEVVGQEAICTILKNMIRLGRVPHAFLFCGGRGTGKTTLARLYAKALNCRALGPDFEPCNRCSSCREITASGSLDILEIDGASNRGIEDIRLINETVGYQTPGRCKVYIIDEVHMLTKEAFNALLKTLEEPPSQVKFFFATTEPHKVPATILSRCQRFNLRRIGTGAIVATLQRIGVTLGVEMEEEGLRLIARMADGALRDAQSLLDEVLSFHDGALTHDAVSEVLGLLPKEIFFEIDRAGKAGDYSKAFEVVDQIFLEGKDLLAFVDGLITHIRNLLIVKTSGVDTPLLEVAEVERRQYAASAKLYRCDQCLYLLDKLVQSENQVRYSSTPRIALEALVLEVMRSHCRIPVDYLVKQILELEDRMNSADGKTTSSAHALQSTSRAALELPVAEPKELSVAGGGTPKSHHGLPVRESLTVDCPKPPSSPKVMATSVNALKPRSYHDTVLQFALVELGGTIRRK